jgi:hypothetical protein
MDVGAILQGHVNELFGRNEDISQKRLNICYACPLYSKRLGGICNNRLWLNVITGDVSTYPKPGYKNGCSCRLSAKTRLANATCPVGKW